jgi:hypothetical protein
MNASLLFVQRFFYQKAITERATAALFFNDKQPQYSGWLHA